jgi:hypothetical protein
MFPPISDVEIEERIRRLGNKAAAGPDSFQKKHLLIPGLSIVLAKLYNILVYCSGFPKIWKENRTTLIPKAGKGLTNIENWRPIAIGPVSGRIFSSMIDARLRRPIEYNIRQKGLHQ